MVKCTTTGGQCNVTDIDDRSRELADFCNRSNLNQLSEAVLRWLYVNSQRGAVRTSPGLMIDGIEPAKCVQLTIQKCQSIQPILRIAIKASRFCADARDICSEPLRDLDVAAFSLLPQRSQSDCPARLVESILML